LVKNNINWDLLKYHIVKKTKKIMINVGIEYPINVD